MPSSFLRRVAAVGLGLILALGPSACRRPSEGAPKVIVIGDPAKVRDPALGPLSTPEAVLLQNVAQGLVQFDASGNIVSGLAERWNVSDDGLSYIFRIASAQWPDGRKITADQVARLLKRQLTVRSRNSLKDTLGAIEDIVPMTDRVIEIRLTAPRPNLLSLLAQPEMAIIRGDQGTGPFSLALDATKDELKLSREVPLTDEEASRREEVLLAASPSIDAVRAFAAGSADLVLGGTFADLPYAQRTKLPRNSLRFDPASGLFGLLPLRADGLLGSVEARSLLSQAIDRSALVAALNVPGLAARATLLEPGLDGIPTPVQPPWIAVPLAQRHPALVTAAARTFKARGSLTVRVNIPAGPGGDILFNRLVSDWGALGLTVERTGNASSADFVLIDEVSPSPTAAWFVRRLRCGAVPVCDDQAGQLMDAARQALIPAQRWALLTQAAAVIDEKQLFIPLAAPIRWSLVSRRIEGFAGNRYARHTLTNLEQPSGGD